MKLFRSLALNENDQIDTTNIGNSWTLCEVFAEDKFWDYNNFAQKDGFVILSIDVNAEDIDMDNTLFAMENRACEYEVVVNNLDVVAEVHSTNLESFEGLTIEGNTGNNEFEDYCTEYEGSLTVKDFINLSNEF